MTAGLPMGGQKITGMADPTVSTDGATKNYVDTTTAAFFSTGDVKLTFKTAPDSGWLLFDDGTFGSATSGSSNSNSANNLALFTLLFNNLSDTWTPIFTAGGGATTRAAQTNASTAWAANCRMSLPKSVGRALAIAGAGSGLTTRFLGQTFGEETHVLAKAEVPPLSFTGTTGAMNSNQTHTHPGIPAVTANLWNPGGGTNPAVGNFTTTNSGSTNLDHTHPFSGATDGGGGAHNNMQPTVFLNVMVKQ